MVLGPTLGRCVLTPEPTLLAETGQPWGEGLVTARTAQLLSALQWRPPGSLPPDLGPLPPTAHWLLGFMWLNKTPKSSAQLNPFVSATGSSDAAVVKCPLPTSTEFRPAAATAAHLRFRRPPRGRRLPNPGPAPSTNSASSAAAAILAQAAKCVLGWLGPSLGRSSPGPSAEGRVPKFFRHPQSRAATAQRPQTHTGPVTRPNNPWNSQFGAVCVKPGDVGARGVPASHAALRYATRLQRPPSAPRFFAWGPGSHGAGARCFPASYRPTGRGGGQRGAPGRPRAGGASGPITPTRAAETVHYCSRVPETPTRSPPSADLITLKECSCPK